MLTPYVHPRARALLEFADMLAIAAETGAKRAYASLRQKRGKTGSTRRPGADSPMWNVLAAAVRSATTRYGSRARLARYLGIPRQRLNDFLTGRSRLPDAELTLRMIHWLGEVQAERDPAL